MAHNFSDREIQCIQAMADNNLRTTEAAIALHLHRNTVIYHLDNVTKKTGFDPRKFHDLSKLLMFIKIIGKEPDHG